MNKLMVLKLLSVEYFIYILMSVGIILALVLLFKNASEKKQGLIKIILLIVAGVSILLEYISRILSLQKFILGDNLPLDTFHIFFYITLFAVVKKRLSWQRFIYLIVMPICAFAILFPSERYLTVGVFSVQVMSYMITNISLLAVALLNMLWLENGIEYKDILVSTMDFVMIIASIHIINVVLRFTAWGLHANYMGTMGEDYNLIVGALYSIIPIAFVELIPLIALLIGLEFLTVLPFVNSQNLKDRQEKLEELVALGNLKAQQEYRKNMKDKSQILLRSDNKAMPVETKDVRNKSNSGFVSVTKEVKTNNDEENK